MTKNNIEQLLQKYYDGVTTEEEEKRIRNYFQSEQVPDHLKVDAALFDRYADGRQEELDKNVSDNWLFEKVENPKPRTKIFKLSTIIRYWHIAASVIILAGALWMVNYYHNRQTNERNQEIAALRKEVQEMKQVLSTGSSASDRIRVVSRNFDPVKDKPVIDLLVATLNRDANVNVRLAACEALYQFRGHTKARAAFTETLQRQTDPMVQFILIDILITIKENHAIEELKKLSQRENVIPEVKQKAAQGIAILKEV